MDSNTGTAAASNSTKPTALAVRGDGIPESLQTFDRWLVWRHDLVGGDWKKVPYNARTGRRASSTDPATWSTYQEAVAAYGTGKYSGVGFTLGESDCGINFAGVDLDDCIPESGEPTESACDIIARLDSYVEVSPSGTGVKLICIGTLPEGHRTVNLAHNVEVYTRRKYFCVTGHRIEGTTPRVEHRQDQLADVWQRYIGGEQQASNGQPHAESATLLQRAQQYVAAVPGEREGGRNSKAFNLAGHVAAFSDEHGNRLSENEIHSVVSGWNLRNDPPLGERELRDCVVSAMTNGTPRPEKMQKESKPTRDIREEILSLQSLCATYPTLNRPVIDGILREKEIANIISTTKIGKSCLACQMALSVAAHTPWLGCFPTSAGRILLIDNELHRGTLAYRIPKVADALGIVREQYEHNFDVFPIRGKLRSLRDLAGELECVAGEYALIILDAKYRFATPGVSENDNASETLTYNTLDQIADQTGAAVVVVHHSTKGSQSDNRVSDVGSGAGAQSRAADTHLILREHEEDECCVLDAALRSFAPIIPMGLRWEFPIWWPDDSLDVEQLKGRQTKQEERQGASDSEAAGSIVKAIQQHGAARARQLREHTGLGRERQQRVLDIMVAAGELTAKPIMIRGNESREYDLPKQSDQ